MSVRRLCICADDFGLADGINRAVVALARRRTISATSLMVKRRAARPAAALLKTLEPGTLAVGLHLDMGGIASGHRPAAEIHGDGRLAAFVLGALAGRLDAGVVLQEIRQQLDRFEALTGRPPDFVDGHQHVHQLPVVRECLLDELLRRYAGRLPWVRSTRPAARQAFCGKSALIHALGGRGFDHRAQRLGFSTNRHLLGVDGFSGDSAAYRMRLRHWLADCSHNDLLMCHPASGEDSSERHAKARQMEFRIFHDLDLADPGIFPPIVLGSPVAGGAAPH